ncbi:Beta-galactosidase-1-like protein [Coemansia sp. 'formosensis']|nr:Beta-galactosidase-1-like protein [Coemansia sp. 'formosensis']
MKPLLLILFLGPLLFSPLVSADKQAPGEPFTVGYSTRGLLINDVPRVLTTGAIHYPRSTPEMWDSLMKKAKRGGLNTIDTYVFWNLHEPTKGNYDFATDRANLPLFLQMARDNGLFVMLRIGPYVCAEWNYGGFPQWLRHEPDVVFRTYSQSFMQNMQRFLEKVVAVTRKYMPEYGGPIIGMQIENEHGDHQWSFGKDGDRYADWCGATAQSFNLTVPWIMCRQYYPVAHVIPTQNDFYCDQYLDRYHDKYPQFPDMWTEMWPGWFQRWGEAAPYRPIEDISYAVAKWFAFGGTYVSYYMYQGGTNFGRTSGPFIQTSYDYDGFIDEYGLENWPKYLHLQELHRVLLDNAHFITGNPVPVPQSLGKSRETSARVYGTQDEYLAFLINTAEHTNITVAFDHVEIELHRWSVTLVRKRHGETHPTILYNTATLSPDVRRAQAQPAGFESIDGVVKTESIRELGIGLPRSSNMPIRANRPLEHISTTDDRTDYLWYRTTVSNPCAAGGQLVLKDAGDVAYAFIDDHALGMRHGQQDSLATFTFDVPKTRGNDTVTVSVLTQTMGLANNQQHMESYARGLLGSVVLCGRDITEGKWRMMPGLSSKASDSDPPPAIDSVHWASYHHSGRSGSNFRWYAIELDVGHLIDDSDSGENYARFAVDLSPMTKGQLWVNQHHLGRYWIRYAPAKKDYSPCQHCDFGGWFSPDSTCRQKCDEISQRYYHLPRSYLDLTVGARNYLYVMEEVGGRPENIAVAKRVFLLPEEDAALLGLDAAARILYDQYAARRGYIGIFDDDEE